MGKKSMEKKTRGLRASPTAQHSKYGPSAADTLKNHNTTEVQTYLMGPCMRQRLLQGAAGQKMASLNGDSTEIYMQTLFAKCFRKIALEMLQNGKKKITKNLAARPVFFSRHNFRKTLNDRSLFPLCDESLDQRGNIKDSSTARLVVVLAGADWADSLAHVVGQLERPLRDESLALHFRCLRVQLRLRLHIFTLSRKVRRIHVAIRQEDRDAVLRLPARQLEFLHEISKPAPLCLDVLLVRLVRATPIASPTFRLDVRLERAWLARRLLRRRARLARSHKEHGLSPGYDAESGRDQRNAER